MTSILVNCRCTVLGSIEFAGSCTRVLQVRMACDVLTFGCCRSSSRAGRGCCS